MYEFKIKEALGLYRDNHKSEAYKYIKENELNVLDDEELAFLHISYCMSIGYYEEGYSIKDNFLKKYSESIYVNNIKSLFKEDSYNKKAKEYNKKIFNDDSYLCLECCICDGLDICIDCGPGDTGCIDLDICCFLD